MTDYLEQLRQLEAEIATCDGDVADLQASLKDAKSARDTAVAKLRAAVREGKVPIAPLLELVEQDEAVDG